MFGPLVSSASWIFASGNDCEPGGADDVNRSLIKGEIVSSINPQTVADRLLTPPGELNFAIVREKMDQRS